MAHDVYICYDEKDKEVSEAVCQMLKDNNIRPWIKSKNMSSDDHSEIIGAIEDSKCCVLIYSDNSKSTNNVVTEIDLAFSRNVPIIVFDIDNSLLNGNLEFILENQMKMHAFPDYKKQLERLVKEISYCISKPVNNVKLNSKVLKVFKKINPYRKENNLKKIIAIAISLAVVIVLIYFFVIVPTGQHTTEDGIFAMNITDVDIGDDNKYTVFGESYNMPSDSEKYIMNIKFFDRDDNMVFEVNSTADEFKSGVICSCNIDENVTHIEFKLFDLNNKVLSQENYEI